MSKGKWNLDTLHIATFAEMCSVSYDKAAQWAEDGTVPSIQMGCFRMINLARFRDGHGARQSHLRCGGLQQ